MHIPIPFDWRETKDDITIVVPLKGLSFKNIDIYVADLFVKISHRPFLLQIDLAREVIPGSLVRVIENNVLLLTLEKESKVFWNTLEYDGNKSDKVVRRKESIDRRDQEIKKLHELARNTKLEEERSSLRDQISLEKMEMKRIEDQKSREKELVQNDLFQSISSFDPGPTFQKSEQDLSKSEDFSQCQESAQPRPIQPYFEPELPRVRSASILKFLHTPRFFKTPRRESTQLREDAFIAKNRPFLKANKYFNTEISKLEETDPMWLKDKGDNFYGVGNYLAAINAYSSAIEKDQTFFKAYMNRSLCYLIIEEPHLCIHDCSKALNMINLKAGDMEKEQLDTLRTKLLVRMSSAHCKIGNLLSINSALANLQEALSIKPFCDLIKSDIHKIERFRNGMVLKMEGDVAFGIKSLDTSLHLYNQAISEDPSIMQVYSNRSAVYLYKSLYQDCIKDCTLVLDSLRQSCTSSKMTHTAPIGGIPPQGSQSREKLVKICLSRRALCYEKTNQTNHAKKDLELLSNLFKTPM